jgi:putative tryptophan/tyrosine transport system substrate-binding protein
MRRREFIAGLGSAVAASPLSAYAQQTDGIRKVGLLWPAATPPAPPRLEAYREGLRDGGFVEGQNVIVELRYAQRGVQQLAEFAAEFVRMKVDVIQANGDLAPRVAQQATTSIPIVVISDDVEGAGLIASLSRPGANTTGLTILSPELSAKRLEALNEVVPGLSRVAALWDPTTGRSQVAMTEAAAKPLNIKVQLIEVSRREDLAAAFDAARKQDAQAVNVFSSPVLAALHREIITLSEVYRLPAIYQWREHVQAGGLLAYGPSLGGVWRQVGGITSRILKGAKPSELPVELPTKLELAVNIKTAKALNLAIPPSMLVRAEEVIE